MVTLLGIARCIVLGSTVMAGLAGPARAQDAPAGTPPAGTPPPVLRAPGSPVVQPPVVLPEVLVTARRREENLRNVPFAVTSVGGQTIEDARFGGFQDLFRDVPNLGFNGFNDSRTTYFSIRGIGPLSQPLSPDDTSVVTYVDGVPQPLFGTDLSFLDVERIEVLRGPQGTLFGRNTSAGAINIITRRPSATPEVTARAELGSQLTRLLETTASGPLIRDRLAGRIAFRYWGAGSYVPNLEGGDLGGNNNYALRGSFVLTPSDRTRVTLAFGGERNDQNPAAFVLLQNPSYPQAASTESRVDRRVYATSLSISHDLGWATLHALTGVNRVVNQLNTDDSDGLIFGQLFGLPPSFFAAPTDFSDWNERETAVSQELRLNAPDGAPVAWIVGVNYVRDRLDVRYINRSAFFAATNGTRNNDLTTNSASVFGEVTVPVVQRLRATVGLRYNYDWKDFDAQFFGNGFPGTVASFRQTGSLTYSYLTGRAALSFDVTPEATVYATAARGYKPGGFPRFNTDAASGTPTDPYRSATYWTYELGARARLLGGRARVAAAAFYTDAKDEQLYSFDFASASFRPANVDVRSYGFEVEGGVRLAPGLDLTGTLGYTVARLRNVPAAVTAVSGAVDGNYVPNVPRIGTSVALQYRRPALWLGLPPAMNLLGRVDHQFLDARFADIGNKLRLGGYQVVNARLGVELGRGDAYVFASNVLDAQYELGGNHYAAGVDGVIPARGRVVGVGGSLRF